MQPIVMPLDWLLLSCFYRLSWCKEISYRACYLSSSYFRIKGLTSDLIGQLDGTSDGREGHKIVVQ